MKTNKKTKNYKKEIFIIFAVYIILFSNYAFAFAVYSNYWSENPLKLFPGEAKDVSLNLQNYVGGGNITIKASIADGSEIAKIIDNGTYFIPLGSETGITFRVGIPRNAKIGENYSIGVTFTTVKENEKGKFGFGSSIKQNVPVTIVEKPKTRDLATLIKNLGIVITVMMAAIVAVIIAFVLLKKKGKHL